MKMTIHIRFMLTLICIYAFIYMIVGLQQSNFYTRISSARAQTASVDRGDIQVGILFSKSEDSSTFLNGVALAVDEINNKTNTIGGKGILFHLPDGKSAISRRLLPSYLPVPDSTDLTIVSPLVSSLKWKKKLVAIVSGLSTTMTLRTRVIPEYYGIAAISVRPTLPSLSQEDFKYFVRTVPNFRDIARYFMNNVPLTIARRSGKKIAKIGIFFSASSPEGYLEELINARELVNERSRLIDGLRAGFESGILNEVNDIQDLRESRYLQTGLNMDPILIERFVSNNLSAADLEARVTLKSLVDRQDPLETPTELVFTMSFLPDQKDYRPLITAAEKKEPDLIVINSGVPEALNLIRQIREMGVEVPVLVTRINGFDELLHLPIDRLTNVYGASMYDPASADERFVLFKERYERFLRQNNKPAGAPDFLAMQGYEAIYLIAQVIEKSNSAIPMNICNTLKYSATPLEGQIFGAYHFSPQGDVLDRKLHTLFFDKGTMTTIKEQE